MNCHVFCKVAFEACFFFFPRSMSSSETSTPGAGPFVEAAVLCAFNAGNVLEKHLYWKKLNVKQFAVHACCARRPTTIDAPTPPSSMLTGAQAWDYLGRGGV